MTIKEAAIILQDIPDITTIRFYVDSHVALRSFQVPFLKSKMALQTIQQLNLVQHQHMIFVWTKAHVSNVDVAYFYYNFFK